jgi:two-component system response regulator NreC
MPLASLMAIPATRHPFFVRNGPAEEQLTDRELQVLRLICEEYTGRQIAAELGISFKTAACHRANIMGKFGALNTAGLVRVAIRRGLIEA